MPGPRHHETQCRMWLFLPSEHWLPGPSAEPTLRLSRRWQNLPDCHWPLHPRLYMQSRKLMVVSIVAFGVLREAFPVTVPFPVTSPYWSIDWGRLWGWEMGTLLCVQRRPEGGRLLHYWPMPAAWEGAVWCAWEGCRADFLPSASLVASWWVWKDTSGFHWLGVKKHADQRKCCLQGSQAKLGQKEVGGWTAGGPNTGVLSVGALGEIERHPREACTPFTLTLNVLWGHQYT